LLARSLMIGSDAGKTHTSCSPAAGQVKPFFPSTTQAEQIVELHNKV
jgi:hypothetical protein